MEVNKELELLLLLVLLLLLLDLAGDGAVGTICLLPFHQVMVGEGREPAVRHLNSIAPSLTDTDKVLLLAVVLVVRLLLLPPFIFTGGTISTNRGSTAQ